MIDLREVIPVIVLVTLGMLLFVTISEQWTANDQAEADLNQYEYLECVPLSSLGNVEAVAGPAEIFDFDGQRWIRFTDIGDVSIKTDQGSKTYKIGKATLELVLLTGQSNAVFYTNPSYFQVPYYLEPGTAFYFGTEDDASATLGSAATRETVGSSEIRDLVGPDGKLRMSQMYPQFCKDFIKESGKRILVLNTGIGGQAIKEWDIPTGRCSAWMTTAIDFLKRTVEEDGRIDLEPLAVLWSQGESDYQNTEAYYLDRFRTLVERLEDGAWGYKFPLVLTVLPRHPGVAAEIPSALAQQSLAEEDDTVIVASTLPTEFGADASEFTRDGIHYTQTVYSWLGQAFARSLAIAEGLQPIPETIVMTESIGNVSELPVTVTAFGTSGADYELDVDWTETDTPGTYMGELSGNPEGTRIAAGLTATATIEIQEEE